MYSVYAYVPYSIAISNSISKTIPSVTIIIYTALQTTLGAVKNQLFLFHIIGTEEPFLISKIFDKCVNSLICL